MVYDIVKHPKSRQQQLIVVIAISVVMFVLLWHRKGSSFDDEPFQANGTENPQMLEQISPICYCVSNRTEVLTSQQPTSFNPDAFQWCSSQSWQRGTNQNVIAYTIFGNVTERYYSLLTNISSTAQKFYPGWIVRIYHNFRNQSEEAHRQLCNVYCQFRNVDLCSVPQLIERIRNTTKNNQLEPIEAGLLERLNLRMFRYLVAFDPNVDIFISRDVDSIISAGQDQVKNPDQVTLRNIVWPSAQYDAVRLPQHIFDTHSGRLLFIVSLFIRWFTTVTTARIRFSWRKPCQ